MSNGPQIYCIYTIYYGKIDAYRLKLREIKHLTDEKKLKKTQF